MLSISPRVMLGLVWVIIVGATTVFVYHSGFQSTTMRLRPVLHENDYQVALQDAEMELLNMRNELALLNDTLRTRIGTLEQEVKAFKSSERVLMDQQVAALRRNAKGIVKLPWNPKTLDGDDDYLDWNPNSVGPAAEWYKQWKSNISCEEPEWCDTWYDEQETLRTQLEIWKLQHPPDCRKVKALILQADLGNVHGIGSHIHIVAQIFSIAVAESRVFLPDVKWPFSDPVNCKSRLPDCWFIPMTNCTDNWRERKKDCNSAPRQGPLRFQLIHPDPDVQLVGWFDFMDHGTGEIPVQYKHKGLIWWRAQQTKYMMRPRMNTVRIVDEYKKRIFPNGEIPHPILAVNVRHSDKKGEAHMYSWKFYQDEIEKSGLRKFGVKSIFMNTEDPVIFDDFRNNDNFGFVLYALNITRLPDAGHWEVMKEDGALEVALFSIVQLYIQTECDWFLGTRLSNWSRLIDELRKTNGKARTPYLTPAHDKANDW